MDIIRNLLKLILRSQKNEKEICIEEYPDAVVLPDIKITFHFDMEGNFTGITNWK